MKTYIYTLKTGRIQRKKNGNRQALYIALITLLMLSWNVTKVYAKPCNIKFFTGKSHTDTEGIASFFKTADLLVSKIIPTERQVPLAYSIVLMDKDDLPESRQIIHTKDSLRIYLPDDIQSTNQLCYQFLSNLIAHIVLEKSGIQATEKNCNTFPKWISQALIRKISRRRNANIIPGTVLFPGTHALILSEEKTDWLKLVSNPMLPQDGGAYNLYTEVSEIMLNSILHLPEGKNLLMDIIELANKNVNTENIIRDVVTKKILDMQKNMNNAMFPDSTADNPFNAWLNYSFRLASVNLLTPCNAEFAEKLFKKAEIVRYMAKNTDKQMKEKEIHFCTLAELPDKMDDILNLQYVILNKQRDLVRIAFAMPISLQNPIYKIEKAMDLLMKNKKSSFKKIFTAEKNKFYDALDKQIQIEMYMLETEKAFVPPLYRYSHEVSVMKENDKAHKQSWPALSDYMDKIEEDMQE